MLSGRRTYLLEYGDIQFADRELGLEHWVEDVIPAAIRAASADAGGRPVRVVGWCLGGILCLLAHAWDTEPAGRGRRARGQPVGLLEGAADRPAAADRRDDPRLARHAALPRDGRRAGAVRQARLPARRRRQVRDEAVDDRLQPRQPRAAGADRGRRRVHGPHARLSRAHLRPALPPLLPHQRPRRRAAGADRRDDRPRRRHDPAAGDRRARRRDRAGGGLPPRRRPGAERERDARDGARRPPRRAHRPRRARDARGGCSTRSSTPPHGGLQPAPRPERATTLSRDDARAPRLPRRRAGAPGGGRRAGADRRRPSP